MKRRVNYIARILLGISLVMLIAMSLPHHHHQQFICLQEDVETCETSPINTDRQNPDKKDCKDCCITKFICSTPASLENHVTPDYTFEALLFTFTDIYILPLRPKESKVKNNISYIEKLYNSSFISSLGLRAPPTV